MNKVLWLSLLLIAVQAEETPAPVTGKIDGKEFRFVEVVALPFATGPDVIDVGVFQEDVKDDMPFSTLPALMVRIPKAGGEVDFRGKSAATFFLPPDRSISAQAGKMTVEKKSDGSYVCRITATSGDKHHLEGTFTLKAPAK